MTYPIPNSHETHKLLKIRVIKSHKRRGRAQIEAIKSKLEEHAGVFKLCKS